MDSDISLRHFLRLRKVDFFGGSVFVKLSPSCSHTERSLSVANPAGFTNTNPFIGLPVMSILAARLRDSADSYCSGPTRTIKRSPETPHTIFPRCRKQTPPNIFLRSMLRVRPNTFVIRSESVASYAKILRLNSVGC